MIIAWILSLLIAFAGGYYFRNLYTKIEVLEQEVKKKIDKPQEQPESTLVDVLDPIKEAQYELDQRQKELNS